MTETRTSSPPTRLAPVLSRRPDIQGIRALAVILVVAFHAHLPIPGGYVGVDVFFVVSGFVITAMLVREKRSSGRVNLARFYMRRFRRLTPALALAVSMTVVLAGLLMSPLGSQQLTATTAVGALLLFANIAIARTTGGYFDAAASTNPLLHTWSLSVEEQFYLIFPLLLIVGWALGARKSRPMVGVGVAVVGLGGVSLAVALVVEQRFMIPGVPGALVGFYGPVGRAWEFAAGALLAVLVTRIKAPSPALAFVLGVGGLGLLSVALFAFSETTVFPGAATLLPVVATVMLLLAGQNPANPVSRALSLRPATALGDISYSWYLWHWPMIVFGVLLWPANPLVPLLVGALSLIPAWVSYRFVEQPLRVSRKPTVSAHGSRLKFVALVAVSTLVPLSAAGALALAAQNGYWSPRIALMQETQQMHAGNLAGCMTFDPVTPALESRCTWNAGAPGEPIYLIGDSVAEHYSEALIGASSNLSRPLTMRLAAGCAAYKIMLDSGDGPTSAAGVCDPYVDSTLRWLESEPAGLVIMGANDVSWWSPSELVKSWDASGVPTPATADDPVQADNAEKVRALVAGLTSTVDRLEAAGHQVVIAQAAPSYGFPAPSWAPGKCSVAVILAGVCSTSSSVEAMDEVQGMTRDAVLLAASRSDADVLDVRDYFCPDGVCVTQRGELGLYLDATHISVPASLDLVPWFTEFIDRH